MKAIFSPQKDRNYTISGLFILILFLIGQSSSAQEIMSWVPPYSIEQCKTAVQADFGACSAKDGLTRIGLQFWVPETNGNVKYADHEWYTPTDTDVNWWKDWGQANDLKILLTIYNNNGTWDWPLAKAAFANNRSTFVTALISEMDRLGLDGIDLDLEGIGNLDSDRSAFDLFVHDLSIEIDARGKLLTISTFPYIWNAPSINWWSDWVGEVDNIQTMGYDELYEGGSDWHKYSYQQNAGISAGYPADAVLMGMPGWLSSWGTSSGRGTTAQAHVQEVNYDIQAPTGIAIWDLQLTGWQNSDLWCEIAELKGSLPCPDPNLGPDVNLCSPAMVDLSPLNQGSFPPETTWQWLKNGTVIDGETSPVLSGVKEAGTYRLTATNTECGSSFDDVVVTSSLPSPIDACREDPGILTLAITDTDGGTYNWFDVPDGGTALGSGTSYTTPSLTATATYYVEKEGSFSATVGPPVSGNGFTGVNDWISVNEIYFDALGSYTLKAFTIRQLIWSGTHQISIEIRNSSGSFVPNGAQTFTLNDIGGAPAWQTVSLSDGGVFLAAGSYTLRVTSTVGIGFWENVNFPVSDDYLSITGSDVSGRILAIHDWQIESANGSCDRLPVIAQIGGCDPDECTTIGDPCDDGDPCTINDVYDANCNCTGTFQDSDNDGVCDADDLCPDDPNKVAPGDCGCGAVETDADNDGISDCIDDCISQTTNFIDNPLSHKGTGYSSTTLTFPADSKDVLFNISNINDRAKPTSKNYSELVTVEYDFGGGNVSFDTYSSADGSTVIVEIPGTVLSITVSLTDGGDGNSGSSTMSISLSQVDFCIQQVEPCDSDTDGDGVCDDVDVCDGWDDNLLGTPCDDLDDCTVNDVYVDCQSCQGTFQDTDGDLTCDADDGCPNDPDKIAPGDCGCGIPEGSCDDCIPQIDQFPLSQLTHSGNGFSETVLSFAGTRTEVSFTISGLGSKTRGAASKQYIDLVEVLFKDELGITQTYGSFDGSVINSVDVSLPGMVTEVIVSLEDGLDGDPGSTVLKADISDVSSCLAGTKSGYINNSLFKKDNDIQIFPNPTTGILNLQGLEDKVDIKVFSVQGSLLKTAYKVKQHLDISELPKGLYILKLVKDNNEIHHRLVIRN